MTVLMDKLARVLADIEAHCAVQTGTHGATHAAEGQVLRERAKALVAEVAALKAPRSTRDNEILDIARTEHGNDECEIDSDAEISEGDDNGAFVQAWVWASFVGSPSLDKDTAS